MLSALCIMDKKDGLVVATAVGVVAWLYTKSEAAVVPGDTNCAVGKCACQR